MNDYKYDIAISLSHQDADYGAELVKALNPKLKVFFYLENQHELVSELGFEKFGNVFKHESRIVVILYRKEWGESTYTQLERAAIQDRMNDVYMDKGFIMMIGMDSYKTPGWYPSTRIYSDPFKFPVEKMAEFIEFKVNELGGDVTPLTFEEIVSKVEESRKEKYALIQYLQSTESGDEALQELENLAKSVNKIIESVQDKDLGFRFGKRIFNSLPHESLQSSVAYLILGAMRLRVIVDFDSNRPDRLSSQMIRVQIRIEELEDEQNAFSLAMDMGRFQLLSEERYRYHTDQNYLKGWSKVLVVDQNHPMSNTGVFFGTTDRYDLARIFRTDVLVDKIFKEFFQLFQSKYPVNY